MVRGNTFLPSGTSVIPARTISLVFLPLFGVPMKVTVPSDEGIWFMMADISVVLPAPLAPIRETISPSFTVRLTPFSAWMAP